jgi:hypothetical protein
MAPLTKAQATMLTELVARGYLEPAGTEWHTAHGLFRRGLATHGNSGHRIIPTEKGRVVAEL